MPKINRVILIIVMLGCLCTDVPKLCGQSIKPEAEAHGDLVKWSSAMKYVSTDSLEITFHVELAPGWAIYSQYQQGTGPLPTSINVLNVPQVSFSEQSAFGSDGYDPIWDLPIKKFVNEVSFISTAFVRQDMSNGDAVQGNYEYMICDSMQCLPPRWVEFEIPIPKKD